MARQQPRLSVQVGATPQTLEHAAGIFLADCKARGLSPFTLALNRIILRDLTGFLGGAALAEISTDDLRRFFIEKATATSRATAARYYDCVRKFFAFLTRENALSVDPMATIQKPRAPVPVIQPLTQDQIEAMVASCKNDFTGLRDRLCLLILIDCGLRASELCGLELADVDAESQQFLVRHGKGDRSRRVPFGRAVLATLRQYMARRAEVDTPALIINAYGDPIDRYRLRTIVLNAARRAGVKHPHMGPHLLRHSCAVSYLRNGGDPFSLQRILGHSTLTMTRRYSELADSDVQDKHRLYSPADGLLKTSAVSGQRRRLR